MVSSNDPDALRAARYASLSHLEFTRIGTTEKPWRSLTRSIREISTYREMLGLLVRRDIKARYKDSSLGLLWSLVRPLTQLLIYYIVVGQFLGAARGIPDFALYIFAGLTAYSFLSDMISGGTGSIINNSGLVKKVYLPREIFPLAGVGAAMFNFAVQLGILLIAALVLGKFPIHADVLYAVPAFLILLIYGTTLAILLSAVNVYLRDIQYLVDVGLMLLLWASPIVYSWEMVRNIVGQGLLLEIYTNNPVTLAVIGFQKAFWVAGENAVLPQDLLLRMTIAIVVGLVALLACHRVFNRLQGDFAQAL